MDNSSDFVTLTSYVYVSIKVLAMMGIASTLIVSCV